jgi:hypothetical protein
MFLCRVDEDKDRRNFYEKLKKTMTKEGNPVASATSSIEDYVEAADIVSSVAQIRKLNDFIVKSKAKIIENSCLIGLELMNLKYKHYVQFCSNCTTISDKYSVLSCSSCKHFSGNSAGIKTFFKVCKQTLPKSSESWINFLIQAGILCKEYPKLVKASITLNQLKKHISWLPGYMKVDEQSWK